MVLNAVNKVYATFFITLFGIYTGLVSAVEVEKNYQFNLPSSSTSEALAAVAEQTGHNLFYPTDKLSDLTSTALVGDYTLNQALSFLLKDSEVIAKISKKGVIIIKDKYPKSDRNSLGFWASLFGGQTSEQLLEKQLADKAEKRRMQQQFKDQFEIISVDGYRDSLSKALSYKRYSDNQIDVISADDIGQLPDVEIGDVLERIAGVQVNRGDDGVVNGTSIRGLPGYFNRTLYNGRTISTSLSIERYFDSQVIPAAFISRVEVHKTAVPNVVEGGLAGVINLKSIRAFDVDDEALRIKFTNSINANSGNLNPDLLAIYSTIKQDKTLGLALGVNYLEASNQNQRSYTSAPVINLLETANKDYNGDGITDAGDNFYLPASMSYALDDNERERSAFFVNLDWRPSNTFSLFSEVFYSGYDTINNRSHLKFKPKQANLSDGIGAIETSYEGELFEQGPRDYLLAYQASNMFAEVSNSYNYRESDTTVAFIDAEWLIQGWTLNVGANLSLSKTTQFQMEAKNLTARNYFNATLDGSSISKPIQIQFHNPSDDPNYNARGLLNDPSAPYRRLTINGHHLGAEYESNSWGLDFDAQYQFAVDNWFISPSKVMLGLHYTEDESLANKPQADFGDDYQLLFGDNHIDYSLIEPKSGQWFNHQSGQYGSPLPWVVPDINKMVNDHDWNAQSVIAAAHALDETTPESENVFEPGIRNDLKEDILAAYLRLDFDSHSEIFAGNIGVRLVQTKQLSSGQGSFIEQGLVDYSLGDPFAEDYVENIDLPLNDYLTKKRTYTELLPSMNLRYYTSDNTIIRFAWNKTMTRPLRQDLKILDEYIERDEYEYGALVTSSDGELEPYISHNLDISAEWYIDEESALSVALFHKDLKSLVSSAGNNQTLPLYHLDTQQSLEDRWVTINVKENSSGAVLKGTTVSFQQPLTYLPSFLSHTGLKTSYTYIDNSRPDLLRNISKNNASVVLYYQSPIFDAHLSYNYRSERVKTLPTSTIPTLYISPTQMLKASLTYKPTENIDVNFAVSNITNQSIEEYYAHGMNRAVSDYGRTLSMTLTAKM